MKKVTFSQTGNSLYFLIIIYMKKIIGIFASTIIGSHFLFAQNVGLGTISPESKLHIRTTDWIKSIFENDAGQARGYIGTDNNGTVTISSNAYWNGSTWVYPNSGASLYMLLHRVNNQFEFRVRPDGGSQNTAMIINVAGNIGMGSNPQQKLDVNGGIKIGNTTNAVAGSIRYNNNKFEGYNGSNWKSFEQLPVGSLTASYTAPNPTLENDGYSFIGGIPGVQTRKSENITVPENSWLAVGNLYTPPEPVVFHTAIWTGSDMIIWGGGDLYNEGGISPFTTTLSRGYRYNPTQNLWDTVSNFNAPIDRFQHTAVWTGNNMVIWGGRKSNKNGTFTALNDGGALKYPANSWLGISSGLTARYNHTAIWTGSEMIVWGGQSSVSTVLNTGGKYNLTNWSHVTTTNAPTARIGHTAVWSGTEMIVWGGTNSNGSNFYNTGAKYNPATDTWTTITTTNAPTGRYNHSAIWTGTEMIVWGGFGSGNYLFTGARYNPTTDTWTSISSPTNPIVARSKHTAIWTGTQMIIWGGTDGGSGLESGGRYTLGTNSWSSMSIPDAAKDYPVTANTTAVWTGQQIIYYGGMSQIDPTNTASRLGLRYFPTQQNITNQTESSRTIYLYQKE